MKDAIKILCPAVFALMALASCREQSDTETEPPEPVTPVQVVSVTDTSLMETIDLNAVSVYLEKSFVKANINGYIQTANAQTGKQVDNGQLLFTLITKEAKAIGNSVNKLDPSLKFSGLAQIRAAQAGLIVQVNHQKGDYVQDGEALATISNRNSLVFVLDLPYAYNQLISANKNISIELPDGQHLQGHLAGSMPSVDSLAQTQRYILKVNAANAIPEGLIAKAKLIKNNSPHTQVLPKSAILANETEEEFWVMKMINDSTAVKVNVKKGIESNGFVEVLSPKFAPTDRIVATGNYGIADTAKVKIMK